MPVLIHSYSGRSVTNGCIHIGLINNMPDEALKATERQFVSLLDAASEGVPVRLSLYTLPGIPRSEANKLHTATHYSNIEDLWEGQLDGLIVTGREPLAADLRDEPYWDSFTRTLAWARENAYATIWSCLAAHAAVLHLDGIGRARRKDKHFGIYDCARLVDHPLMTDTPSDLKLPHSRWNSLPEERLAEAGYTVLSRTTDGEVDTFIKQEKRLFVFFQGHPEYEADTLLREYRRDVMRYFKGEMPSYPLMPQGYFDGETAAALDALQLQSSERKDGDLLPALSTFLSNLKVENTWQPSATRIYQNWLRHIRLQKNIAGRSSISTNISTRARTAMAPAIRCASPAFDAPAEA